MAAQKDKMVDLWRRKCRCGSARNAFIPHYVATIQYSAHAMGKQPGMQARMNEPHKMLKNKKHCDSEVLSRPLY